MPRRPNILLLFTDQQRYDTIHALGNPVIRTPALDRLCQDGTAFTSAYSPSPVCVPARACMHYGRYPANINCTENGDSMPDSPSFMQVLSDNGYYAHGIGKCHFTPDRDALRGFDSREVQEEVPAVDDTQDYKQYLAQNGYGKLIEPHGARGEHYYIPQISALPAEVHPTQWVGDRSINFMESRTEKDAPWFLFSSFIHPHPPFCPPSPWHKLYRPDLMPDPKIPDNWEDLQITINRQQNRYKVRDSGWNRHLIRCMKAHYYACISFVDYQVGRIIDTLEKLGELENTLILFSSDHGEHLGDYRCFGKRSMHDSCARVPMLARLPGRFQPGQICNTPVSLVDIATTILTAAGIDNAPIKLDGEDMVDIAIGKSTRQAVFSQRGHGNDGIYTAVTDKWKYAYSAPDNREYLFDRINDPQETRSFAAHTLNAEVLKEMRNMTHKWLAGCECKNIFSSAVDDGKWRAYPANPNLLRDPEEGKILQDPGGYEKVMQQEIPQGYLQ